MSTPCHTTETVQNFNTECHVFNVMQFNVLLRALCSGLFVPPIGIFKFFWVIFSKRVALKTFFSEKLTSPGEGWVMESHAICPSLWANFCRY